MAVTIDPNAVFISYSGIGNETVKKFIAMLDEKRIPHRDSESEFIQDELTDFEEKIGMANIIVIFYSPDYFKKEHCMNEYANIRKCENKERKAATYYVKCENFTFADILKELKREWGGNFAEWKDEKHENLKPITQLSMANGCYIDENTPYCVQKLDNYFSKKIRFTESNLQDLVELIEKKYCKLSNKNTPVIQEFPTVSAPHFPFSVPDGLMQREDEGENLFNLISKNRIFNLVGVGGSGKSSLTYLSLKKHEKDFNEIAFVVVNNNVKNDMVDQLNRTLKLEFEEDAYTEIVSDLQDNFKSEKDNLLVLDINETADKDKTTEYINEILQDTAYLAGWKILILSRENVETRNRIKTHNLNDKEDFDFLKKLFLEKAGARYSEFSDFAGLFKVIYYNPLLAEQLGWYLNDYPKTATLDGIKKILYGSLGEQEMQGMSAAQRHDENVNSFLKNLIVYDKLEENEQKLLRHFVLWQSEYIGYDVIADLLKYVFASEDELTNTLKSLSRRSILATNNEETLSYKLHGLLKDSLREQIDFEKENYFIYLLNIDRIIEYGYYKFVPFVDCITNSLCEYDIAAKNTYVLGYSLVNKVGQKLTNSWKRDHAIKLLSKNIRDIEEHIKKDKDNNSLHDQLIIAHASIPSAQSNVSKSNTEKAIEILEKMPKDIENYQHALALVYRQYAGEQSKFEDVVSIFDKIFEIRHNLPKTNKYQNALAEDYRTLAHISEYKFYKYEITRANYEKAIAIGEQLPKDNPEFQNDLANTYNNLANLQQKHLGEYDSAKENYEKAIEIGEQLPKDNPEYQNGLAWAYKNLAILQENRLGDYDSAKANYEKAIEIREQLPKDNPDYQNGLAGSYNNLAILQENRLGDYDSAKSYYEKAIAIREQLPKDNPEYQNGLASAYHNLANLQQDHLGDYELSKSNYEKAIAIREQLPKDNPEYQNGLASAYNNLANLQKDHLGDYDSAKANYEKAIAISEQLPKDNPEYQNGLAWAYNNLGALQMNILNDYTASETNWEKAIKISEKLPKDNPKYQYVLAMAYNNPGVVQINILNDYAASETNYKKAIEISEQLPKDNPIYQYVLAQAYNNLGVLQMNILNDYTASETNYKKAIAIQEQLPKGNPIYQYALALAYHNLANLQQNNLGDYNSAKGNNEKAIKIIKQLPKDNPEYQNVLARSYNNLAYTYDKLKDYDKAIESINTAIDIASKLKETDSKYLILWLACRHSLSEIKYKNGRDLDDVKNTLLEIKPIAQQCLKDNPDDEDTKTVNDDIADLLSKIDN